MSTTKRKTTMFEIEKNVPMPKSRGKWQMLYDDMEVGDSVEVCNYAQAKSFTASIHRNGGRSVLRPTENGVRVWLTKKVNTGENNVSN